jgi:hypothetical protein
MLLAISFSRDEGNRQFRIFGIRCISKGLLLSKQAHSLIDDVTNYCSFLLSAQFVLARQKKEFSNTWAFWFY